MELRKITQNELNEVLRKHKLWLDGKKGGKRAVLDNAVLRGAVLDNASLRSAVLDNAMLDNASLRGAVLDNAVIDYAMLDNAVLDNASLRGTVLDNASLRGASIRGAVLDMAVLDNAFLRGAVLDNAVLKGASLRGTVLDNAFLRGASLRGTVLDNAFLRGARDIHISFACPSHGGFTAWKKCQNDRIVQLFIPADARRLSATTERCRCDKARVDKITSIDGSKTFDEAVSRHDSSFVYRVGETVSVEKFNENRWNECSSGIHFFIDREEAVRY